MIHIAGTNGKGSTAAMIASVLKQAQRKVGLYTSPHLVTFNERIRVNDVPIDDKDIVAFLDRYRKDIDRLGSTFFETTTALTFHHFARKKVDVAVMEVGMGGRLDSSNVGHSVLSVLTPVDVDHGEYLGYDLASITREKCGILRENVPVVVAPQHDDVLDIIRESASHAGSDISYAPEASPVSDISVSREGTRFYMENQWWKIPLLGKHQATNAQTAAISCRLYDKAIAHTAIEEGLQKVFWPGRLQRVWDTPPVYYDVAHNPHGLAAVLETLRDLFSGHTLGVVFGLKKKKDIRKIGHLLKQYCAHVVTTAPENGDFFTSDSLAHELSNLGIPSIAAPSLPRALDYCKTRSLPCDLWLIFGTHYISGDVFRRFHFPFDKDENWSKLIMTARLDI